MFPRRFCCTHSSTCSIVTPHSHSPYFRQSAVRDLILGNSYLYNRTVSTTNWTASSVPRFDPFQPSPKHCSLSISGLQHPLYQPSHVRLCSIPDESITYSFMSPWGVELSLGISWSITSHGVVQNLQIKPEGVTRNARTPRMPPTQNSADDREKTMYPLFFFLLKHTRIMHSEKPPVCSTRVP